MTQLPKILLIDAHAVCYRAFYAVRDLRNSKGQPTNAVFGFVHILRKLLSAYAPAYAAACFDVGRKTKRQEAYAAYKAQRSAMPEDLVSQIPLIKALLKGYRIPVLESEGYEADDLIATLTARFLDKDREIIIASDDKDMHQLLVPGVRLYNSRRDALLGPEDTRERFGVTPGQMVDYLALAGDASDNIPGVEGVGEVTARNLISTYGSVDSVLEHVDALKGKLKDRITQGREDLLMSRALATLDAQVPMEEKLSDLAWQGPDDAVLRELFTEWEFKGLLGALTVAVPAASAAPAAADVPAALEELVEPLVVFRDAHKAGALAIFFDEAQMLALCAGGAVCRLTLEEAGKTSEVLASPAVRKIVYDGKALRRALALRQMTLAGEVMDIMLAGYLYNAGRAAHDLDTLSWGFLKKGIVTDDALAQSARVLWDLDEPLREALKADGLDGIYRDMEAPLSEVLAAMEVNGVALDLPLLAQLSRESEARIADMSVKLYALAGETFNLNSPKQLAHVLFDNLGLKPGKKTKTGYSTDEEELTRLAAGHELPALLLEYRQLSKLKSTYIDALPKLVDPATGRLHGAFNQAVAETGRLSSSQPNLQNIPARTQEGRMIRKAFIPSAKDRRLLAVDYSQIELRVLAHLSDDANLRKAFWDGEDIHRYTAALIFDVAPDAVTTEMRYSAKRINFGIVYGMSSYGLSRDLGIAPREAQAFIDRYFLKYPGIPRFMEQEIKKAQGQGFVTTLFGRRRYIPDINSKNQGIRQFAERQAINTPVQGTAADLIKIAMVRVSRAMAEAGLKSRMTLTVHDELVFDVPQKEMDAMVGLVKTIMEGAAVLTVPIVATVKAGPNWAEMQEL